MDNSRSWLDVSLLIKNLLPIVFGCIILIWVANQVAAEPMRFWPAGNGGNCAGCEWIAAEGEITTETPKDFLAFIEENGTPHHVVLHSPGGNLLAGIELGEVIRSTGASTNVGRTVPLHADGSWPFEQTAGSCASACAFAFMGGVERWVHEESRLGVHQFYTVENKETNSQAVQAMVGLTLIHSLRMGVGADVIVAASATAPEEIYWFNRAELVVFDLLTDGYYSEEWKLEPYNSGLVLTTVYHDGPHRSVNLTLFCRERTSRMHLLVSEPLRLHDFFEDRPLFVFHGSSRMRPTLSTDFEEFEITEEDVEFQRITNDRALVSIKLPENRLHLSEMYLRFDPDMARASGGLFYFRALMPNQHWTNTLMQNCI